MSDTIDMTDTIVPKSNQLNADDLITGPITVTITRVSKSGGAEQPIAINYEGDRGKPYYPCKTMRRLMVHVWGADAGKYTGHSMTLFYEPSVKYGGVEVGGIRISHMTGLKQASSYPLAETKAKRVAYRVQPLTVDKAPHQEPPKLGIAEWGKKLAADLDACADRDAVDRIATDPDVVNVLKTAPDGIKARINALISAAIARVTPATDPADGDDGWPGPKAGEAA